MPVDQSLFLEGCTTSAAQVIESYRRALQAKRDALQQVRLLEERLRTQGNDASLRPVLEQARLILDELDRKGLPRQINDLLGVAQDYLQALTPSLPPGGSRSS